MFERSDSRVHICLVCVLQALLISTARQFVSNADEYKCCEGR